MVLKISMEECLRIAKRIQKKNTSEGDLLYHYKTVYSSLCHWRRNRQTDLWNGIEGPEVDPSINEILM